MIKVIEAGGNIEEMKGQKHKSKKSKKDQQATAPKTTTTTTTDHGTLASGAASTISTAASTSRTKKVTQFSFLGYSLGGLIGRFAMGILELEGFFDKVQPVYFVTMATPHLGIRKPTNTTWSKVFNYLSSTMLSRSGKLTFSGSNDLSELFWWQGRTGLFLFLWDLTDTSFSCWVFV